MSSKVLFRAGGFTFYEDGSYVAHDDTVSHPWPAVGWTTEEHSKPGDDAFMFWVWEDGSKSLCNEDVQTAYRQHVARMIVT